MIADETAERAVLGCVLAGVRCADTGLSAEAFTGPRRHVWEAMVALEQELRPINAVSLSERLHVRKKLGEVGGPGALGFEGDFPPHLLPEEIRAQLPSFVPILTDRAERRALEAHADTLKAKAHDLLCPPAATASSMAARLAEVRGKRVLRYAGDLVPEMLDRWDANRNAPEGKRKTPTLPWPHAPYEERGPLRGKMFVVAGRSGNFKTGLVSDAIWHWGHTLGLKGGVMGLEDGCSWFLERLTARRVDIAYEQVGYARLNDLQEINLSEWCNKAHATLSSNVFMEDDKSLGDGAMVQFHKDVYPTLHLWADSGAQWALVDHGLCIDWMTGSGVDRYDMAIGRGLRMCSRLAERTGMAVGFLWHLNRVQDEGTFPKRSDLAESAFLDREARRIDVLWRQPNRPGFQLSTCVKATKGEEGVTMALPLFDAPYGLLGLTGGYRVDFEAEEQERRQRAEEQKKAGKARVKLFGGGNE